MNATGLDDLITERTRRPQQDPTVALTVRRLARIVAVPAFCVMLGGLALALATGLAPTIGELPGPSTIPFAHMAQPTALASGQTAMSLGLLALAALPAMSVMFILARYLKTRRWMDAIVTAALLAILAVSALVK